MISGESRGDSVPQPRFNKSAGHLYAHHVPLSRCRNLSNVHKDYCRRFAPVVAVQTPLEVVCHPVVATLPLPAETHLQLGIQGSNHLVDHRPFGSFQTNLSFSFAVIQPCEQASTFARQCQSLTATTGSATTSNKQKTTSYLISPIPQHPTRRPCYRPMTPTFLNYPHH